MFDNFHLNPLRGALIIGAFSSALAAPTLMSASHYARDLPTYQLEPANAPVQGPHLAARTRGLDLLAGVQARALRSENGARNIDNDDEDSDVDHSDKSYIFFPSVRQVSDDHTRLQRRAGPDVMSKTADEWRTEAVRLWGILDRKKQQAVQFERAARDGSLATPGLEELKEKIKDLEQKIKECERLAVERAGID
ncbi:hypothetical protein FB446DRAFT_704095 [Lentinula raphanica]|nr:hypothetical protein FB446DRAFT_704095 [Lentinula raphanica]